MCADRMSRQTGEGADGSSVLDRAGAALFGPARGCIEDDTAHMELIDSGVAEPGAPQLLITIFPRVSGQQQPGANT